MSSIALTLLATAASGACPAAAHAPAPGSVPLAVASEELEDLYRSGIPFEVFFDEANRRRELWEKNYQRGSVAPEMVERVRALGGEWRLLAIAEDWCSDSVSTIPFLALLAEQAPNLEMRVIRSDAGSAIMESHRTPDDRAATPTVLILTSDYQEAGCLVERPPNLQAWALPARQELSDQEFVKRKMSWYDEDGGASTVRAIVEGLEAAAAGSPTCISG
jgi:hypothetical protein